MCETPELQPVLLTSYDDHVYFTRGRSAGDCLSHAALRLRGEVTGKKEREGELGGCEAGSSGAEVVNRGRFQGIDCLCRGVCCTRGRALGFRKKKMS